MLLTKLLPLCYCAQAYTAAAPFARVAVRAEHLAATLNAPLTSQHESQVTKPKKKMPYKKNRCLRAQPQVRPRDLNAALIQPYYSLSRGSQGCCALFAALLTNATN